MAKLRYSHRRAEQICDYGIGYCYAQYLLNDLTPWACVTSRSTGWCCDIYDLGSVILSTGYWPVGNRIDYDTVRKYEEVAEKIVCEESDFKKRSARLSMLRNDFIREVRNRESA